MKNVSYYRHLHPESLKKLVAITKITAVSLLTVLPSTMQAEPTYSQSVVISIKTERMLLTDLFSQIEKQSEFLFFYVDKDVAEDTQDKEAAEAILRLHLAHPRRLLGVGSQAAGVHQPRRHHGPV